MAAFDVIIDKYYLDNFKGYTGNPPSNKEEYEALDCWKDKSTAPSWDDISVKTINEDARIKRSMSYPSIGDQLDDLFHAGAFSPEMAAKIQAIKDKYPKG